MATSVRTKAAKKQLPFQGASKTADAGSVRAKTETKKNPRKTTHSPHLVQALVDIEDACLSVLHEQSGAVPREAGAKLKNIATPLSLALRECKGPRRFHYHYRHDPEDYDTLTPVAGPSPYEVLARLCEKAIDHLHDFHVIDDAELRREISQLQHAAQRFVQMYRVN